MFRGNKAEDEGDAIYTHGDFSYSPVNIYDCVFVNGNSVKGKIHEYSSNGSFNSLSDLINDNDDTEISLNRNYTFNSTFVDDYLFTPGIKINRSLTINGNGFTIDGSHKARIFNISSDVHVKFLNINFINGNADRDFRVNGGAIYSLYNDCCLVENCTFIANTANFGGAMYGCTVKNSVFINNNAKYDGGAVNSLYNDSCLVENCTFIANTAYIGGAMYGCTVKNSVFIDGNEKPDGGVIFLNYKDIGAKNMTFSGNKADYGGAMAECTAYNCIFSGNTANINGGALYKCIANLLRALISNSFHSGWCFI